MREAGIISDSHRISAQPGNQLGVKVSSILREVAGRHHPIPLLGLLLEFDLA